MHYGLKQVIQNLKLTCALTAAALCFPAAAFAQSEISEAGKIVKTLQQNISKTETLGKTIAAGKEILPGAAALAQTEKAIRAGVTANYLKDGKIPAGFNRKAGGIVRGEDLLSISTPPKKLDLYLTTVLISQPLSGRADLENGLMFNKLMGEKTLIFVNNNKESAGWFMKQLSNDGKINQMYFKTAAEALSKIKEIPDKQNILVFTDIQNGLNLLKTVKNISPDIPVVAAAAGINDDNRMTFVRRGFDGAIGLREYQKTIQVSKYLLFKGSMKNIDTAEYPPVVKNMINFFLTPGWEQKPIEEIQYNWEIFNDIYFADEELFNKIQAVHPGRPLALHYYKLLQAEYDKEIARGFDIVDRDAGVRLGFLGHCLLMVQPSAIYNYNEFDAETLKKIITLQENVVKLKEQRYGK